jgi:hypothetical protein
VEQHLGTDALAQLQCLLNHIIEWEPR